MSDCKTCGGCGEVEFVYEGITPGCCGQFLPTGECCGNAIPVQTQEVGVQPCPECTPEEG